MTPLPQTPTVLLLVNESGEVINKATNVSPDTEVNVTNDPKYFEEQSAGLPFIGF